MLSCGPVNISSVEYCGATGCTIAKVVVAWQSVVGGSATTAKLRIPPRLGACAKAASPNSSSAAAPNRDAARVNVTGILLSPSFSWQGEANMRAERGTITPPAGEAHADHRHSDTLRAHSLRHGCTQAGVRGIALSQHGPPPGRGGNGSRHHGLGRGVRPLDHSRDQGRA